MKSSRSRAKRRVQPRKRAVGARRRDFRRSQIGWVRQCSLGDLITPEAVIPSLKAKNKKQLLQELVGPRRASHRAPGALHFRRAAAARAAGLDRARPGHRHSPLQVAGLKRIVGIFARLAEPIDFDAVDGEPVDIVFLLLAPEGRRRRPSEGAGAHLAPVARGQRGREAPRVEGRRRALRGAHRGSRLPRRLAVFASSAARAR